MSKSLNPSLFESDRARDQMTIDVIVNSERCMKKFNYCEKFLRDKFLQPLWN